MQFVGLQERNLACLAILQRHYCAARTGKCFCVENVERTCVFSPTLWFSIPLTIVISIYRAYNESECCFFSVVHKQSDEPCICVKDSRGNDRCYPPNCDHKRTNQFIAQQSDEANDCICVKDIDGRSICSPPNCDHKRTNQFIAQLSKMEAEN